MNDNIIENFDLIIDNLMNKHVLKAGVNNYRLCELEVYINNTAHPDIFTHDSEEQSIPDIWYFHKRGGTYKSGTYKGLDITHPIGDGFGGILVRSIMNIKTEALIEGPCNVVNELLRACKQKNISDLVDVISSTLNCESCPVYDPNSPLHLAFCELNSRQIYTAPRVGLTLKGDNREERSKYIMRDYRYSTFPKRVKKLRYGWVLSLYKNGMPMAGIVNATGVGMRYVKKYVGKYNEAVKNNTEIKEYYGKSLKVNDLCSLYGLCHK